MSNVICSYCSVAAELVKGSVIYPHRRDLQHKSFWRCAPCKAWVGCHPRTDNPLGRLANAELRKAKQAAHASFDPLWLSGPKGRRTEAYKWLAGELGLHINDCHIGMFNVETCQRVVMACQTKQAAA